MNAANNARVYWEFSWVDATLPGDGQTTHHIILTTRRVWLLPRHIVGEEVGTYLGCTDKGEAVAEKICRDLAEAYDRGDTIWNMNDEK